MLKLVIAACCILHSAVLLKSEPRIIGGIPALNGQFPYQVSIQLKLKSSYAHFCGGSLIDLRHVVTAAHCIRGDNGDKKASDLAVWAGGIDLRSSDGQRRNVKKVTVHPDYGSNKQYNNDIAMLELAQAFERTKNLDTISLANSTTPDDAQCVVSGWGYTISGDTSSSPRSLMHANVSVVNHAMCNSNYKNTLTENMICAAGDFKDACQGDSGGPLARNNKLIGVVSFGIGCGIPTYPGVYTNVLKFVKWIEQNSLASMNSVQMIQIFAMLISSTLYSLFYR